MAEGHEQIGCGEGVSPSLHGEESGRGSASPQKIFEFLLNIIKIVHFRGIYVNFDYFVGHLRVVFMLELLRCLAWIGTMICLTNHHTVP